MIYVDEMMPGLKSHRWPYTEACHLFWADDVNRESGTTVANRRWLQRMLDEAAARRRNEAVRLRMIGRFSGLF